MVFIIHFLLVPTLHITITTLRQFVLLHSYSPKGKSSTLTVSTCVLSNYPEIARHQATPYWETFAFYLMAFYCFLGFTQGRMNDGECVENREPLE